MKTPKTKRAYALFTSVMAMTLILALSGLIFTLVASSKRSSNLALERLSSNTYISQIATNFAQMPPEDFQTNCLANGFVATSNGLENDAYLIKLDSLGQTFSLVQKSLNQRVAYVLKSAGQVVEWNYLKESL